MNRIGVGSGLARASVQAFSCSRHGVLGAGLGRRLQHAVEQPLNQILQSIEGPVAKIIAVIIIITTGLTLAFGDTSGGFRRLCRSSSASPSPSPRRASFSPLLLRGGALI